MEEIKGPTPNGGEYACIYFYDNDGNSVEKKDATNGYIVEFDKDGNMISESRFIVEGKYESEYIEPLSRWK